jgi:hypothetical protein
MKRESNNPMTGGKEVWNEPTSLPTLIVIAIIAAGGIIGAFYHMATYEADTEQASIQWEIER